MSAGPELENGTAEPAATITRGEKTSEYAQTKAAAALANLATVLGLLGTFGATIADAMGTDSKAGIIAGAVVTIVGVISRTLVTLGYTKSRTDVKVG